MTGEAVPLIIYQYWSLAERWRLDVVPTHVPEKTRRSQDIEVNPSPRGCSHFHDIRFLACPQEPVRRRKYTRKAMREMVEQ